jgi:peroxiredoxin family protein
MEVIEWLLLNRRDRQRSNLTEDKGNELTIPVLPNTAKTQLTHTDCTISLAEYARHLLILKRHKKPSFLDHQPTVVIIINNVKMKLLDITSTFGMIEQVLGYTRQNAYFTKEDRLKDKVTIMVHSDSMDKLHTALVIANGALATGMEATLFVTFWGLYRLRKGKLESGTISKCTFLGLGAWRLKRLMKKANAATVKKLLDDYKALGGKIYACDLCMKIFKFDPDDMMVNTIDEYGGVGTYLNEAKESKITLFI